jgi:hypothetical protein
LKHHQQVRSGHSPRVPADEDTNNCGVISVYVSQEEARRAERNTSVHNRQVHVIDEDEGGEVVPEAEQKAEAHMR